MFIPEISETLFFNKIFNYLEIFLFFPVEPKPQAPNQRLHTDCRQGVGRVGRAQAARSQTQVVRPDRGQIRVGEAQAGTGLLSEPAQGLREHTRDEYRLLRHQRTHEFNQ